MPAPKLVSWRSCLKLESKQRKSLMFRYLLKREGAKVRVELDEG